MSYQSDKDKLQPEHGTMQAYIIGFILSLVFTLIPYYLVLHHVSSGTKLLAIILGFGVLQMLVQLLFFLHLGRRPRPYWQIIFYIWTIGSILIVVGGSLIITHNLHSNMTLSTADQIKRLTNAEGIYQVNGKKTGACEGQHANHQIIIKNNSVLPVLTTAQHCDTLTLMNQDNHAIEIGFGQHPAHTGYAGEGEYTIRAGQNKTITLSELGTYNFHDHLRPTTAGTFTVTK